MGQVDRRVLLMVDQWFFFFLINCVGVLGLHDGDGGDGGDERERETKREREINIFYYAEILF